MFTLTITSNFRAGHQIAVDSVTEPYHIHDWIVETAVSGNALDENGLLLDFNKFKKIIDEIIGQFEGQKLEDLKCFEGKNTTAENVAKYIFDKAKTLLPKRINLLYVEVTETHGCKAKYDGK